MSTATRRIGPVTCLFQSILPLQAAVESPVVAEGTNEASSLPGPSRRVRSKKFSHTSGSGARCSVKQPATTLELNATFSAVRFVTNATLDSYRHIDVSMKVSQNCKYNTYVTALTVTYVAYLCVTVIIDVIATVDRCVSP